MQDYLVKGLAFEGQIRAFAVRATETVSEAQRRHDSSHTSTAALGRSLVGGLLLGSMQKGEEKMTIQIQGDGPGGKIVVDSNGKGQVKGYIDQPHIALPLNDAGHIDVRGAVGTTGSLSVTKDLGLKEPFIGQVPLVSGELGEDFTYYLAHSEQIPSAVGLSVKVNPDETVKAAGGFMIQVMPGATDETITEIEQRLSNMPLVSDLIDKGEEPETILARLLGEENLTILDTMPVAFHCDCSKDRFSRVILTLGKEEIQAMIDEDHGAEAVCYFCGEKYHYSEQELEQLIEEIESQR